MKTRSLLHRERIKSECCTLTAEEHEGVKGLNIILENPSHLSHETGFQERQHGLPQKLWNWNLTRWQLFDPSGQSCNIKLHNVGCWAVYWNSSDWEIVMCIASCFAGSTTNQPRLTHLTPLLEWANGSQMITLYNLSFHGITCKLSA